MEPSLAVISTLLGHLKVITLVFFGFAIRPIAAARVFQRYLAMCAPV